MGMITQAQLDARLATAQQELAATLQRQFALQGMIADLQYWIEEIAKEDGADSPGDPVK